MHSKIMTAVLVAVAATTIAHPQSSVEQLEKTFRNPPDDARVMMRWWWFGPAVEKPELLKELQQMKAGGFGGYEIQPVYPLELDNPQKGFRNLSYLSPEFLDDVRYVNQEGNKLGMRASITLSSGWPYGGPHTSVTEAAGCIREAKTTIEQGQTSAAVPALSNGEILLAVFAGPDTNDAASLHLLPLPAQNTTRMSVPADLANGGTLHWYIASRTGQQVKRPAVDADGFVLDHFSADAVQHHLHAVADKLIDAFGNTPPSSVFSDSLEVYGSDWTPNLLSEFRKRRGYDLTPHLPELFSKNPDEQALSVRHDWGLTLTELIDENYLAPITAWAHQHHTQFRSQTYGPPAVSLSSNALVDLPEGEGPQWRQFSFTRWATSASHVYGRPVTSAETWTWLHSPVFRATPLDMKAEADRFFLQGVNQLIGHGWPYSPASAGEPGWHFYAAAVFNTHNPWWIVMPDVAQYMQRVSWILRQGEPANSVAIYLPEDDAWAAFSPGKAALTDVMPHWITPELTQAIEDAGYNFDYIDAKAIATRGIHYPVLILPHVERMAPETLAQITDYLHKGGHVIALGNLPSHGTGLPHFAGDSKQVVAEAQQLFADIKAAQIASSTGRLGDALHSMMPAGMALTPANPAVGFIQRRLPDADIYFIANTGNTPVRAKAVFHARYGQSTWLDPDTGTATPAEQENGSVNLNLPPYGSRILVFTSTPSISHIENKAIHDGEIADLSTDWQLRFADNDPTISVQRLHSWTDEPNKQYFSGVVTYRRSFTLAQSSPSGAHIVLNFGEGTPISHDENRADHPGMHALFTPPIREAAVVYLNGRRVAALWHPPYEIDITNFLKPGENQLEVRVANTAINELAGQSLPDYRLLWARYGKRFVPQDMEHLEPLPSGLLGKITLVERSTR